MKKQVNYYFLGTIFFLIFFGTLFLATLSAQKSLQIFGNTNYYSFRQLTRVLLGLFLCFIAFKIPLSIFKKFSFILLIINLLLLAAVFLPYFGTELLGAKRWVNIGGSGFQPSEFLKITAILYLSAWLSNRFSGTPKKDLLSLVKKGYYNFVSVFLPFLAFLGIIVVLLYLQKDISTLGIIGITLITIYFASGTNIWHTVVTFIAGIASIAVFIRIEPYRLRRLTVFLHPEIDSLGMGHQVKQSLIAIGSGGFWGKGLGMSTQKFGFIPEAMSDSIFAVIGEEMGTIGCMILIGIFLAFFWQGIKIANDANDKFAKLTAIGICTWITFQAFINISSAVGIFPLAGIPLPFFSYGGSHIISELIGVGILLNISKNG